MLIIRWARLGNFLLILYSVHQCRILEIGFLLWRRSVAHIEQTVGSKRSRAGLTDSGFNRPAIPSAVLDISVLES